MSEDLTQKLRQGDRNTILTAINNLDANVRSSIDKLVTWVDSRIQSLEKKVERIEKVVEQVEKKVERIEKKVDERLYDTRPIWHKVVADIAQLQAGQQRLEKGMEEVSSNVRTVSRDQIVINDAIRKIQLDYHAIDERLQKIELRP